MKLCFATNNRNKHREISEKLGDAFTILSLRDVGIDEELPENQDTLEGNSLEKARYVHQKTGLDCFADDTGLEVLALNGAPGVRSARYAGPQKSSADNITRLLSRMEDIDDRRARFRTVITLMTNEQEYQFEGGVSGRITTTPLGTAGFGYDPVFQPDGFETTFAQMELQEKNAISHRALAIEKLVAFLRGHGH